MAYSSFARRSPRWVWVLCSALLTFVVMLVLALLLREPYLRWQHLRYLRSEDAALRAEGLQYVARRADDDPQLRAAAGRLVEELPMAVAERVIAALQRAGAWGPDLRAGYLRWLRHLAAGDASSRASVAVELAGLGMRGHGVMTEPETAALVGQLLAADTPLVRYHALSAAAGLPIESAGELIRPHLEDDDPRVRRWARLLEEALGMNDVPSAAPPMHDESTEALVQRIREAHLSVQTESDRLAWRAILTVPLNEQTRSALLELARRSSPTDRSSGDPADPKSVRQRTANGNDSPATDDDAAEAADVPGWPRKTEPLRAAAISRVAAMLDWNEVHEASAFSRLAWLETAPAERIAAAEMDMARLSPIMQAAVAEAIGDSFTLEPWQRLFETDLAPVRHRLIFAALEHLNPSVLDELIDQLSRGFYDGQRMAAALLIGLRESDTPGDPLSRMKQNDNPWLVQRHLVLAELVRFGQREDLADQIEALLTRDRFPRTTALMVGLHGGTHAALDELLQPLGARRALVRATLDQYRMALILDRYLPADARPAFDLYADGAWQAWQVDRLRAWYLVHRRQLRFDPTRRQFMLESDGQ